MTGSSKVFMESIVKLCRQDKLPDKIPKQVDSDCQPSPASLSRPLSGPTIEMNGVHDRERVIPWSEIRHISPQRDVIRWRLKIILNGGEVKSMWFASRAAAREAFDCLAERLDRARHPMPQETQNDLVELRRIFSTLATAQCPDSCQIADFLLTLGMAIDASDLHLDATECGGMILYRLHGQFLELDSLHGHLFRMIVNRLRILADLPTYVSGRVQEGALHMDQTQSGKDARLTIFPTVFGDRATVRFFSRSSRPMLLDQLGFNDDLLESFENSLHNEDGLILVTGPANSGKTTTLYAALSRLIAMKGRNAAIHTVEDPVECRLDGIAQTNVRKDAMLDYETAIATILRQDPEIIMIGEIRDRQTAAAALRASLTGHLVLSTLHCGSASEAVIRLLDMGLEPYQVAAALRGVMSQRLVPIACTCQDIQTCSRCLSTGVVGRRASGSWLRIDEPLRRLIMTKPLVDEFDRVAAEYHHRRRNDLIDGTLSIPSGEKP